MSRITALIFDLDQTLFDRQQAFDHWLATVPVSQAERIQLREIDRNGYGDRRHFFETFQSLTGSRIDQPSFTDSLIQFVTVEPSLYRRLGELQGEFILALFTNGGAATQHAKLKALAMASFFAPQRVFISSEMGMEKPDRQAFHYVARTLGVPDNECLYFGDRIDTDVVASQSAGWQGSLVSGPLDLLHQLNCRFGVVAC